MPVRGGGGHRRAIREHLNRAATQGTAVVEVGFKTDRFNVAGIATALEFGTRADLPERPAFRKAAPAAASAFAEAFKARAKNPLAAAEAGGIAALAIVRNSYLNYVGPGLAASTLAAGANPKELQGVDGPRLIGHLHCWVNGELVE